ncbi:hypothetical protein QW131_00105 [Roseibium salinum]|nr:hypothetical protein [Roseibium salinum]
MSFFKAYFVRKYRKYGWWGLILSMNYAHARFLRVAKAYEAELLQRNGRPKDAGPQT